MIDEETIETILRALNEWEVGINRSLEKCSKDSQTYKHGYREGYKDCIEDITDTISMSCAIKIITRKQARKIIRYHLPRGLYLFPYGKYWAALDNSTGDVWTRTFDTLDNAKTWLRSI